LASRELVIVLTPESTSIADAYGLLKSLKQNGLQYPPFLVINKIRSKRQAQKIWHRFREVCKTKLGLSLMFLGLVPMQEAFEQAQHQQQPLVQTMPDCAAARSFWTMARRLRSRPRQELFKLHIQEFWNQALLQYTERSHWIATQQGQESDKEQLNPEERLERIQHDFRQLLQSNSNTWDLETLRSILKELHAELDQAWSRLEEKADAKTDYAQHLIGIKVPDQIRQILFDFMALIPQFEVRSIDDSPEELQNIAALICSEQGLLDLLDSPNLPYVQQVPTLLLSSWGTGPAPQKLPDWLEIKKVLAPPYDLQELQFALHNIVQETQQRDSKTENDQQAT
ncbi:MAG: MinD/ParA family ATP-binding protein, partial [Desulfohalobiaceae bacterium]